ncbi:MAG: Glutamine--fructose-6-phosphate transaminase (isomerizing) [Acidimicrobiaceae bacterium]|nr:Glutamine--fructose-6-phosphate transaminase (isomerizing) [Acidimicrobiaceae bacterium]
MTSNVLDSQMLLEIKQQPMALERTIISLLARRDEIRSYARGSRAVLFFARGSSDNAAIYGRYLCEMRAGLISSSASPSVWTTYGATLDLRDVLAVAVSQSGHTEELVECVNAARHQGARTIAITNVAASPLAQAAELSLVTEAGPELAVPATKSYTSQLVALAVLAAAISRREDDFAQELAAVPAVLGEWLEHGIDVDPVVDLFVPAPGLMVAGNGLALTTANEIALKVKETCYLLAEGLSGGDLLHGPLAALDASKPALLLNGGGPTGKRLERVFERVRSIGAKVAGIGPSGSQPGYDAFIEAPSLSEELMPVALVVPGQMIAERLARRLGFDPDAPRGLSKVTQTDPA